MTQPTLPPRPSLATLLRNPAATRDEADQVQASPAADEPPADEADAQADPQEQALDPAGVDTDTDADTAPDTRFAADTFVDEPVHAPAATLPLAEHATDPEPAPAVARKPQPSFARGDTRAPVGRRHWAILTALIALLLLQITLADRARLAADAGSRPLVETLCSVLRCTLPPWHEPTAFTMLSREIRPVPGVAGALQVNASFRNDARWAQAWPMIHLSLSDADGRKIGEARFAPAQYLGNSADAAQRLAPGQSAQVAFRLREPSAATVAFSFDFE